VELEREDGRLRREGSGRFEPDERAGAERRRRAAQARHEISEHRLVTDEQRARAIRQRAAERFEQIVRVVLRRELIERGDLDAARYRAREDARGLAGADERARERGRGPPALAREPLREPADRLTPFGRERPAGVTVRAGRQRVAVADDIENDQDLPPATSFELMSSVIMKPFVPLNSNAFGPSL
jgi:hypothetical protein